MADTIQFEHQAKVNGKVVQVVQITSTLTHHNKRLMYANGHTYEAVGVNGSGNRIYRDQTRIPR